MKKVDEDEMKEETYLNLKYFDEHKSLLRFLVNIAKIWRSLMTNVRTTTKLMKMKMKNEEDKHIDIFG